MSGCGSAPVVLLVDDEEVVRRMGKRMLSRLGYDVILAESGQEAIEIYHSRPNEIALVILDLIMPSMTGREAQGLLREIDPEVHTVLSSGYDEQEIAQRFAGKDHAGFIQKPYTLARLREALQAVLAPQP